MTNAEAMQILAGRALINFTALASDKQAELMDALNTIFLAIAATQTGDEATASSGAAANAGSASTSITDAAAQLATLTTNFPAWPS